VAGGHLPGGGTLKQRRKNIAFQHGGIRILTLALKRAWALAAGGELLVEARRQEPAIAQPPVARELPPPSACWLAIDRIECIDRAAAG